MLVSTDIINPDDTDTKSMSTTMILLIAVKLRFEYLMITALRIQAADSVTCSIYIFVGGFIASFVIVVTCYCDNFCKNLLCREYYVVYCRFHPILCYHSNRRNFLPWSFVLLILRIFVWIIRWWCCCREVILLFDVINLRVGLTMIFCKNFNISTLKQAFVGKIKVRTAVTFIWRRMTSNKYYSYVYNVRWCYIILFYEKTFLFSSFVHSLESVYF